jgi:hypothetical protein
MRAPVILAGAVCFAWALTAALSLARADDAAAAQALFDQAKVAMAAHNYAEACPKLAESLRLQEALGTLLNLADCYEREGKLASAWSKFLEVSAKARAAGNAARARIGHDRAAALAPKLSTLVVDVPRASRVDGLEVRRDGTIVGDAEWGAPIPIDPGTHTVEASAPGRKPWSHTLPVAGGAKAAHIELPELERLPVAHQDASPPALPPPPASVPPVFGARSGTEQSGSRGRGMKIAAIAAAGVGAAGVGVGTVFGLESLSRHNAAAGRCPPPGPSCSDPTGVNWSRDSVKFGDISTVAFAIGGAALAAGVVLWFLAPKAAEKDTAHLVVGPGSLELIGAW